VNQNEKMKKIKTATIVFFLVMNFCSCDEGLTPPTFEFSNPKEKLLIRDWTYDYILMGSDTVRALSANGEPQTTGIFEAVAHYYMRYEKNHSYYFKEEGGILSREYGTGENYQPKFGYWYLSEDGNILIHNKLQTYEKRYEILELTDKSLRIKLIGDRTSILSNGDLVVIDTINGPWIEVFVPRSR
jgi:hypothetical protein